MSPRNNIWSNVSNVSEKSYCEYVATNTPPYSAHLSLLTYCVTNNMLSIRKICDSLLRQKYGFPLFIISNMEEGTNVMYFNFDCFLLLFHI